MVDARSYVTAQTQPPTLKQQALQQTQMDSSSTSELQRRAVEIAAESMAALFTPKRARLEELGISMKEGGPTSGVVNDGLVQVHESALKRLKQSEDGDAAANGDAVEEQQCGSADGGACPRRSSGSDRDLESDGASSSAPEQRKTPPESEQPARKVRVRKPTYAVRKVRLLSYCLCVCIASCTMGLTRMSICLYRKRRTCFRSRCSSLRPKWRS